MQRVNYGKFARQSNYPFLVWQFNDQSQIVEVRKEIEMANTTHHMTETETDVSDKDEREGIGEGGERREETRRTREWERKKRERRETRQREQTSGNPR